MICDNCKKHIEAADAYTCDYCHRNFCEDCANSLVVCSCYGEFKRYC